MKNEKGFGLTEVLIALAMVTLLGLAIAQFISPTKSAGKKMEDSARCLERVNYTIDQFKTADNKSKIDNWHSTFGNPKPSPSPFRHAERFTFPIVQSPFGANVTYDKINSWELIDNGLTWALALYNTREFCSAGRPPLMHPSQEITRNSFPGGFSSWGNNPNLLYPPGPSLNGEHVYLNIQRYDHTNGTTDCASQGTLRIAPLGTANRTPPAPLQTSSGLNVTAVLQYVDQQNQPQQCRASASLGFDGDMAPPSAFTPVNDLITGPCPGPHCYCQPVDEAVCFEDPPGSTLTPPGTILQTCGSTSVTLSTSVVEPGVVFVCELDYATTQAALPTTPLNRFQPCSSFTINAAGSTVTGTVTKSHSFTTRDLITGIQLTLTNVVSGYYSLFIKAFDSAQNQTMVTNPPAFQFQQTNACPAPSPSPSPLPSPSPSPSPSPGFSPIPSPTVFPGCRAYAQSLGCLGGGGMFGSGGGCYVFHCELVGGQMLTLMPTCCCGFGCP